MFETELEQALFIALCNTINNLDGIIDSEISSSRFEYYSWKARISGDEDFFSAGVATNEYETITFALPIDKWDSLWVIEKEQAKEGTSKDIIGTLSKII